MTEIRPPRRPTMRRWSTLSTMEYSIYRSLEYEAIAGISLPGTTLDVGGGRVNSYYHLFRPSRPIISINIAEPVRPTVLGDATSSLPFKAESFDNVVSLNTLEHLLDEDRAISEIMRVLRPMGTLHLGVPFLYRVHGSPHDYHRHTAEYWASRLVDAGMSSDTLVVEPLVWEPLASAFSLVEFTRLRSVLKKPVMAMGVLIERRHGNGERLAPSRARRAADFALGYYITGRKNGR